MSETKTFHHLHVNPKLNPALSLFCFHMHVREVPSRRKSAALLVFVETPVKPTFPGIPPRKTTKRGVMETFHHLHADPT